MGFIEFTGNVLSASVILLPRHHKDDDIGFFHSDFCLVLDLLHKRSIDIVNPSRINHTKGTIEPLTRCIDTVTCHTSTSSTIEIRHQDPIEGLISNTRPATAIVGKAMFSLSTITFSVLDSSELTSF